MPEPSEPIDIGSPKQASLDLVARLPDDCIYEDILYEVLVLAKIQRGLDDVAAGRTIPHAEVMRKVDEWLRSMDQ